MAFVNIDDVKMSKSLGNFITVHDALKTIDGQKAAFLLAAQHYRKPINFTEKAVHDAATNLKYLKNTYGAAFHGSGRLLLSFKPFWTNSLLPWTKI